MEVKEMLKEIVAELLDKDFVREIIEDMVGDVFQKEAHKMVEKLIDEACKEKARSFIEEMVREVVDGKIIIDDGWGNRKKYDSFGDFVREHISNNLKQGWRLEDKVFNAVKRELKSYVEMATQQRIDLAVDDVLNMIADDIKKEDEDE